MINWFGQLGGFSKLASLMPPPSPLSSTSLEAGASQRLVPGISDKAAGTEETERMRMLEADENALALSSPPEMSLQTPSLAAVEPMLEMLARLRSAFTRHFAHHYLPKVSHPLQQ